MYLRAVHTDLHLPTLYQFIKSNPLGIFTTAIKSPTYATIQSSHIPWILDIPKDPSPEGGPIGKLRGHVARANPQCKAMIEALAGTDSGSNILRDEVMVLFNGPVHHYVSPKFYTETKPDTGKVVGTWNYSAVQVYGTATVLYDSKSPALEEFLNKQLDDLSKSAEEDILGYTGENGKKTPWKVSEAPQSYISALKKAIIGIEIEVTRMEGKFKMSQELKDGDREGAVKAFREMQTDEGEEMARTIEWRDEVKREKEKVGKS